MKLQKSTTSFLPNSCCIPLLGDLCCARAWQVEPSDFKRPAILVTSELSEFYEHVSGPHIRDLESFMCLREFGDVHHVPWVMRFPGTVLSSHISATYAGIIVLLSGHPFLGRFRLALCKQFPAATVVCRGFPIQYGSATMAFTDGSWHHEAVYRDLMLQELLLIADYGSKGIIVYPESVQSAVQVCLNFLDTGK